jgi:hypothetical protein
MSDSQQYTNIAAKLVQVMKICGYVQKDSTNKEQKYNYVSAAAIAEKVNAALVENRLISVPRFTIVSEKEKSTARGGVWQLVTVQCNLHIVDVDSGESVTVVSLGTGTDPGDKAVAKAQTMAIKYAWLTALNIETGDEPEADPATDRQEFVNQQPVNPIFTEICSLWQLLGWEVNSINSYLEKRFNKPVNQVTDTELTVIANEAKSYLQQMRGYNA